MEFKTDEAVNLLLSQRVLTGNGLTPGGTVSSIGILNPPLFNYILIPLIAIDSDPKFVAFVIALINALSVSFFYLIIKKYFNIKIAAISSILFALSPWAVLYSRKIWMQDLLIPLFILLFFCIEKIFEKKKIYEVPYWILSLFIIQLHQASIIFIGIITAFLLRKARFNVKLFLIGIIIGFLPIIPYISYEIKNNCPDCTYLLEARNRLKTERSFETFIRPLQITSQGNFRFVIGNDTLTLKNRFPYLDILRRFFYLEYILIPLSLVIFYKKFKRERIFVYSVVLLPTAYFLLKIESFMHYYILLIPIIFLCLGVLFDYSISKKILFLRLPSLLLLILLIFISAYYNYAIFNLLKSRGSLDGDYGSSYSKTERDVKSTITKFKGQPDYQEVFLSSFIPLGYTYGYLPLGKILYGDTDEKELKELENKLKNNSRDPRVAQRIFAFYTRNKTTLQTLDYLRVKALNIPQYGSLYKEVLRDYLYRNFKKEYESVKFGIRFLYPQHWIVRENEKIILEGDGKTYYIDGNSKPSGDKVLDEIIRTIRPL